MLYAAEYASPVGRLFIVERDGAVAGLWIEGQKYYCDSLRAETPKKQDTPLLCRTKQWLDRYFHGERPEIGALPLSPAGSAFRREVWKLLCDIPYGETTTYGEIAKKLTAVRGPNRMSARAVGGAVGHNPISIIIPCHRVIGANGSLTGYAGGIETKVKLLLHEGVDRETLCIPPDKATVYI